MPNARTKRLEARADDDVPTEPEVRDGGESWLRILAIMSAPAPCDSCLKRVHCARNRLACKAFAQYTRGVPQPRWRLAPMIPDGRVYGALFRDDETFSADELVAEATRLRSRAA